MDNIRPLNHELQEVANTELHEDPTHIAEDLESFRTWITNEPHLNGRTDNQFLLSFLRFCKFNLDEAKKRYDYFYTYKTSSKDLLNSQGVNEKILDICKAGIFYTLPEPQGPAGPRIHFMRMSNIIPSIHPVQDLFCFHTMRSEIEMNKDDNWNISGFIEIVDFSKIPFGFLRQYDSNLFRQMANLLEYGIPSNLMGTHVVNAPMEAQIVLTLVRSVMKQKNLLNIHSTVESLQQAIGKAYLPVEYGGTNGSLEEAEQNFEQVLLSFKNYFDEDEQYGVDEKLRQVVPKEKGFMGTLRRLVTD